jgi:hypothetical protein
MKDAFMPYCFYRGLSLCITIVMLFGANTANAWSIFGPATFEDCVLENMKGVSSDAAAASIRVACRKKFPQNEPQPSAPSTRSGYPRIDSWEKPYPKKIFDNIKLGTSKYNQYNAYELQVTNKTNINIVGLYIGVPAASNSSTCPSEKSGYTEIYECSVEISPNTTKTAFCSMPKATFCISGVMAAWEPDVDKFFRDIFR